MAPYWEEDRGCNLEIPYLLTVLLSVPFDKLPCSEPTSRNSFSSTPLVIRACSTNQQDCPSTSYSPMGRLVTVIENTFGVTYVQFLITYLYIRWLLRFEFQLPHPILRPALATDRKWTLVNFISLTKTRKSADQKRWLSNSIFYVKNY